MTLPPRALGRGGTEITVLRSGSWVMGSPALPLIATRQCAA